MPRESPSRRKRFQERGSGVWKDRAPMTSPDIAPAVPSTASEAAPADRATAIRLFLTTIVLCVFFLNAHVNTAGNRYTYLAMSMVDFRTVTVDSFKATDPQVRDNVDFFPCRGHFYISGHPGLSVLGTLGYLAYKATLQGAVRARAPALDLPLASMAVCFTATIVPLAVGVVALWMVALQFGASRGQALFAALAFATSSLVIFDAVRIQQNVVTGAFLTMALAAWHYSTQWPWRLSAGFLAGYAVLSELSAPLGCALLFAYVLATRPPLRDGALFVAGALPPLLAMGAYNHVAFGSPFANFHDYWYASQGHPTTAQTFLATSQASFLKRLVDFTVGGRGLFVYCPLALLGVVGMVKSWRTNRALCVLCAAMLVLYLALQAATPWQDKALALGPRYAFPALPFLFLMIPWALPIVPGRLLVALSALSVLMSLASLSYGIGAPNVAVTLGTFLVKGLDTPIHQWLVDTLQPSTASATGFYAALALALAAMWAPGPAIPAPPR